MATHSSILAWRIPWTEEPGRPQSMGLQTVGHNSVTKQQYKTVAKNFPKTASVDLFTRWKSKPLWPVLFFLMDRSDQIMTLFKNFISQLLISFQCSLMHFTVQRKLVPYCFPYKLFCPCLSAAFSPKVTPLPLLLHTRTSLIFETRSTKLSLISYQNSVTVTLVPVLRFVFPV